MARVDFDDATCVRSWSRSAVGAATGAPTTAAVRSRRRNELQLLGRTVYFFTTEDIVSDAAGYGVATVRCALAVAA